jgi:hypothetical protein
VLQIKLKRRDAEHLLLRHAEPHDYALLVQEEAAIYKDDGKLLARLIKDAVDLQTCEVAHRHLKTVDGALSARASVLGTKLIPRIRRDGSKSKTMAVAPEILEAARRNGARADFLGYKEAEPRYPFCRQTAWTREHPDVLLGVMPLIRAADCIYRIELPSEWERQHCHVSEAPAFRIGDTAFSTLTVNKNLPTTYHRDEGDYLKGFGVMLTLGSFTGGYLCFPEYGLAVDYRPGDVILADVHSIHGNLPIYGDRIACVLYARAKINECGSLEKEWEKANAQARVYMKTPETPEEWELHDRWKAETRPKRSAKAKAKRQKNKFPKITFR